MLPKLTNHFKYVPSRTRPGAFSVIHSKTGKRYRNIIGGSTETSVDEEKVLGSVDEEKVLPKGPVKTIAFNSSGLNAIKFLEDNINSRTGGLNRLDESMRNNYRVVLAAVKMCKFFKFCKC